jgi:hypothetical protein
MFRENSIHQGLGFNANGVDENRPNHSEGEMPQRCLTVRGTRFVQDLTQLRRLSLSISPAAFFTQFSPNIRLSLFRSLFDRVNLFRHFNQTDLSENSAGEAIRDLIPLNTQQIQLNRAQPRIPRWSHRPFHFCSNRQTF